MNNLMNFALNLIAKNPSIANDPRKQEFINIIQNGDSKRGEEVAKNLCDTYGVSVEDATAQAKRFFNL